MPSGTPLYHLTQLSGVGQQIRNLADNAADPALRARVLDAVKMILHHLEHNPLEWGDPDYRTKKEGGLVCLPRAAIAPGCTFRGVRT
jgi:hypothetical protein